MLCCIYADLYDNNKLHRKIKKEQKKKEKLFMCNIISKYKFYVRNTYRKY